MTCNNANMSKNHEKTATTTTTFDLSLAKIWRCLESSCATIWCFSEAFWDKYASFQYRVRHVGAKLSMGMMSTGTLARSTLLGFTRSLCTAWLHSLTPHCSASFAHSTALIRPLRCAISVDRSDDLETILVLFLLKEYQLEILWLFFLNFLLKFNGDF